MSTFWRGLETLRGWVAVPRIWRKHLGAEDFERVRNTMLIPTGRQGLWFPSPDGCECQMDVVKHAEDHIVGVSECGGCDDITLTTADVALWELNLKKFGRAVATALQCEPRDVDVGVAGATQIAAFGRGSTSVILVMQHDRRDFSDVLRDLVLQLGKNFIVLSPTSRFMDANGKVLLDRVNAGFFGLDSILTVTPDGMFHAERSADELFAPSIGTIAPEPQLLQSVAKTVEGIAAEVKLIAKGNYELREAKERLEQMQGENLFKFVQKIDAKDFRIVCYILVHGTIAKASRVLEMSDSAVRLAVNGWKRRGGPYRGLADLVEWRKRNRVTGMVSFNENVLYGKNSETSREAVFSELLDGLLSMTENNWQDVCDELKEALRSV